MTRYITRAWSSDTHTPEDRPSCTVYEAEDAPIDTGLLDANGTPLYRLPERRRIGFAKDDA